LPLDRALFLGRVVNGTLGRMRARELRQHACAKFIAPHLLINRPPNETQRRQEVISCRLIERTMKGE
jgi:hypothetical protein